MPPALRPALYQALAKDAGPAYAINKKGCATLPKTALKACFGPGGARFAGARELSLHLAAFGRGARLAPVAAVNPVIEANRVSYRHGNLSEWWRVLPMGFEQGFTIAHRPAGDGDLVLALTSRRPGAFITRHSRADGNPVRTSPSIPLRSEGGKELAWGKLRYGHLVVTDAKGKVVPATLKTSGDRILIAVNDARAAYPLTVDPLIWLEQQVTGSGDNNSFGYSLAVDGTTALFGAPDANDPNGNEDVGVVYVFNYSEGVWSETQELTASDAQYQAEFGWSVALDGATAVIAAPAHEVGGIYVLEGAVYVFNYSGGVWSETQEFIASDGQPFGLFGTSVALDGTTALISAGQLVAAEAYIFSESGGIWTQTQTLVPSDDGVYFGDSVALDGTTALIGAGSVPTPSGRAVYVFAHSGGTWTQTQELTPDDAADVGFGVSVALDGSTAIVGNPSPSDGSIGTADIFSESGGTWTQTQVLSASEEPFGASVALDGTTALISASYYGTDYLFSAAGGTWTQTQKITDAGGAVALQGGTAVVGGDDDAFFLDQSDLDLAPNAPESVAPGANYVFQTIATNNASAASPAVALTVPIPAAASFVSATATEGQCYNNPASVYCYFGSIAGNAGTATANITFKATGSSGTTIVNVSHVLDASPSLSAEALTDIVEGGTCPDGYTKYERTLAAGEKSYSPPYDAPAGEENAILTAPDGFQLYGVYGVFYSGSWHGTKYRIPGNEVHRWAPAGRFMWIVTAGDEGGAYTLCILHP
ncbi:MAG TPA: hypothetical protein VFX38_02675 [Gammaproteobacteria bacterium]|nr:hypothetical protein [Gammaproteobacteria bacterium]